MANALIALPTMNLPKIHLPIAQALRCRLISSPFENAAFDFIN
jgi:hypothetical protein